MISPADGPASLVCLKDVECHPEIAMQADERMLLACLALVLCIPAVHYENKVKCAFLSWAEATFVSTSLCAVAVASHKHPRLWLECLPHADLYPAWMPAGVSCSGLPVSMARQESTDSWTLHSKAEAKDRFSELAPQETFQSHRFGSAARPAAFPG